MNNINLKNIIIESVSENKSIFAGLGSLFIGLIVAQVIFPRQYSNFVAEIPNSITKLDYKVVAFILIPYLAAELLYYVADLIDSRVMPEIELSVIKKLSDKVFQSVKTTKKEVNANELILNLKKIF